MATLNVDVPAFDCWVRGEYLRDLQRGHGEYERATIFGLTSIPGRALGFWALVHEAGACVGRLPITALHWGKVHHGGLTMPASDLDLDEHQLWDCFSSEVSVWQPPHMDGRRCEVTLKSGAKVEGEAQFCIDWHGSSYAESAGPQGWKCAWFVALEDGNYCALPNNRIRWFDPASQAPGWKPGPLDYELSTREWSCEGKSRWGTTAGFAYSVGSTEETDQ